MNLGNENDSRLRRGWTRSICATGFAVVVGAFGLVGVHRTEGRADAAAVGGGTPVVDLPVPPRLLLTPEVHPPTTTSTVPVETTTTTAAPPPTTVAPNPPPAKPRAAASTGPQAQAQVEAIADSSGWNWRAAGVRFAMGFYPADCCHWGVYEAAKSIIWVGPTAFEDQNRLRYVVLHELAHDLVLAPVVLLAGVALARAVGGRWRAPIQAALFMAGTLILFTYPELRGYGHALRNPTSLPHNYATNLAVVLAAVGAGTITVALVSASRRPGAGRPGPGRRPGSSSSAPRRRPTRWPGSRPRPPGPARSS